MSVEVLEERVNPLLARKEVRLVVGHAGAGTPDRMTVRTLAARQFNATVDRVFVKSISTRTGGSEAVCKVEIYEAASQAQSVVPAYLKNRNLPRDQRVSKKKGEEAKPQAPAPKAAAQPPKPAEKKAQEVKAPQKPETKELKPQVKPEAKPKA